MRRHANLLLALCVASCATQHAPPPSGPPPHDLDDQPVAHSTATAAPPATNAFVTPQESLVVVTFATVYGDDSVPVQQVADQFRVEIRGAGLTLSSASGAAMDALTAGNCGNNVRDAAACVAPYATTLKADGLVWGTVDLQENGSFLVTAQLLPTARPLTARTVTFTFQSRADLVEHTHAAWLELSAPTQP